MFYRCSLHNIYLCITYRFLCRCLGSNVSRSSTGNCPRFQRWRHGPDIHRPPSLPDGSNATRFPASGVSLLRRAHSFALPYRQCWQTGAPLSCVKVPKSSESSSVFAFLPAVCQPISLLLENAHRLSDGLFPPRISPSFFRCSPSHSWLGLFPEAVAGGHLLKSPSASRKKFAYLLS